MGSRYTDFKRFESAHARAYAGAAHSYIKFALQNSHKNSYGDQS
jgi:hypothetical protein